MTTEMWNSECDRMCFILRENLHLYNFFMDSQDNKDNREVMDEIKNLHKCNWFSDQSYLLCINIVSNTIKDTMNSISHT